MKFLRIIIVVLFLASAAGCVSSPAAIPDKPLPRVIPIVWSHDFDGLAESAWQDQIERRWPHERLVVVYCHGGIAASGAWQLAPDKPRRPIPVAAAARFLRDLFGGRRLIVFVTCNVPRARLGIPGVFYAGRNVWIHPGPDRQWCVKDWKIEDCVGNAWELKQ